MGGYIAFYYSTLFEFKVKKKKILVFIDWFFPGYRAGGPIQSCTNLIEHLKDEFEFLVVTRDTDYMEDIPYLNVKSDSWNILSNGIRVYYISKEKLSSKTIRVVLSEEKFDVVYLNGIYSIYFTLFPLYYLRRKSDTQVVVAVRGMLALSALGVKQTKKKIFLSVAKAIKLFKNVVFHATNEQEEIDIRRNIGQKVNVKLAPNLWRKDIASEWKQRKKNKQAVQLISVARISPEKNTKYAIEVLSKTKGRVEFDLYGPVYNKEYWEECKVIIKALPSNASVNYKGSLQTENVLKTLSDYHFLFIPTRGENFGHAILQAMSVGVPVIISDQTMWRNLEKHIAGWDIPLSAEKDFISVIEKCINMSQEEYDILSKGAFNFSKSFVNNKNIIEQNRQLFVKS
ncbi:MAG: glycosyltransferase [Bacteroidetes bacterium]|nr:glycosyltransferase [Bacteroidota bacterium]